MDRLSDLIRFYALLDSLDAKLGSKRTLAVCNGRMNWPTRGVYFFFEPGEERHDSGGASRVVRVGTHALTTKSRTTLWNRLSQHKGVGKTGGGNHRGSIFRLIVGSALKRREGLEILAAVREAGTTRFVPDSLTSLTTVGGLLPLTLQGSSLWAPMGWTIIGGLLTSTCLILLIVPVLYLVFASKHVEEEFAG